MTAIPFEPAVAYGLGGLSLTWLCGWGWEEWARGRATAGLPMSRRSWQCQICTAFYTTAAEERLTVCPRCGSYNSEEGVGA